MFTGIIESTGIIKKITATGSNKSFWIASSISSDLKIDQSVAHNGVCLTVEKIEENLHCITAIDETINKTNLGQWKENDLINLERCLQMNGRLDGHLVQGHVDSTGICTNRVDKNGSWEYQIQIDEKFAGLIIEKGSITLNGISLTIFNVTHNSFTVAIIPFTFKHTNMQQLMMNDTVNLEFDMIGKYVSRLNQLK